jgi:hypothetical protein
MKPSASHSSSTFFSAITLMFCAFAPVGLRDVAAQNSTDPGTLLAARLEAMLSKMTGTVYQSNTEINEETGSLKCDCSGIIGHVLRDQFPEAYLFLWGMEAPWRARPIAVTYYETFAAAAAGGGNGRWRHVEKLMDIKPGQSVIDEDGQITPVSTRLSGQRVNFVLRADKVIRALRG